MKHITIEMLLDAVENQSAIFEDGDTFSDDVLSYMISGGVIDASNHKYKHRELLLKKLVLCRITNEMVIIHSYG